MLAYPVGAQNPALDRTRPPAAGILPQGKVISVEDSVSLRERAAQAAGYLESPGSLHEMKEVIEQCFATRLSIEPLPEQCSGATESEVFFDPFWVLEGERFGDVIARLEGASQGRWIFDEIHGVPLLRPDKAVEGHGTLLDTVISVDIEASSMWEALCALSRAVNRANQVDVQKGRPLIIRFLGPTLMRYPPPMFVEEKSTLISLKQVSAREGLCAIFAQVGENIQYSYTCVAEGRAPEYDYIDIGAFDGEGAVINGGRMGAEDYERLLKSEDWMSDDGILAVQVRPYKGGDGE